MAIDPATLKELQDWAAWKNAQDPNAVFAASKTDPSIMAKYNGQTLSPEAQQYAVGRYDSATGKPANGVNGEHFDEKTGKIEKNGGFMDLPESKWILAAAAGLAAPYAVPALAGLAGGGGAGAGATATATDIGAESVPLASSTIGTGMVPALAGGSSSLAGGAGGAGGILSRVTGALSGKAGDLLGAGAEGLGAAANSAAHNRGTSADMDLQANREAAAEQIARAKEEQAQRNDALKQGYYANYLQNRKAGPYNTAGLTPVGGDTLATAMNLAQQSRAKLANGPQYDTSKMPPPLDPNQFMDQYGKPGTLEKTSNWLSPTLSTLGKVAKFF
jgi:hypothetical protein